MARRAVQCTTRAQRADSGQFGRQRAQSLNPYGAPPGHLKFRSVRWASPSGQRATLVDFMGFTCPRALYCNAPYLREHSQAIRIRMCLPCSRLPVGATVQTARPVASEEYFAYAAVLHSVLEHAAEVAAPGSSKRPFTFVEVGCGYGCKDGIPTRAPRAVRAFSGLRVRPHAAKGCGYDSCSLAATGPLRRSPRSSRSAVQARTAGLEPRTTGRLEHPSP
eukprot:5035824-Prymnesium_polylepis.1